MTFGSMTLANNSFGKSFGKAALALVGVMVAVTLSSCGFNTIPTKEESAKAAWSEVQVQYKRRADLIPQLVATVKGAAANERGILTDVINARASATKVSVDASTITDPAKFKQFQQSQDGLSSAIGRLMVIQEQYPNLKSNEGFTTLMSQLEGTANRISVAQRDYNEAAKAYNLSLRTFPSIIWAKTVYGGNKPMEYFTAPESASVAPTVDFSDPAKAPASAAK